ncbi:hypothetical protein ABT030_21990 [Streptomyces mirabilis]
MLVDHVLNLPSRTVAVQEFVLQLLLPLLVADELGLQSRLGVVDVLLDLLQPLEQQLLHEGFEVGDLGRPAAAAAPVLLARIDDALVLLRPVIRADMSMARIA